MFKFLEKQPIEQVVTKSVTSVPTIEKIEVSFEKVLEDLYAHAHVITQDEMTSKSLRVLKAMGAYNATTKNYKNVFKDEKDFHWFMRAEILCPSYPIINLSNIEHICNKYNLICTEMEHFIGIIPDKNIEDIDKFITECGHKDFYTNSNETSLLKKGQFLVCAPKELLNLSEEQLENSSNSPYIVKEDPIILFRLYDESSAPHLVITAWGPESKDPILK